MAIADKMLVIRRNDFLAKLTDDEYTSLNVEHNFILADKNSYIYFDPQNLNKLYFVKDGYVKIGNIDDEGNEIVRDILQPGDVFGQFTLEQHNMAGEFAMAYKTEVSLCAFKIDDFEQLLNKLPQLSIEYSKKVGNQLWRIHNRLANLLQKDARTRLLFFFWTLLLHDKRQNEGMVSIENYFTHDDIARLTGTSRQTITTLIGQLTVEGIIDVDRKHITIKDVRLLQKEIKAG